MLCFFIRLLNNRLLKKLTEWVGLRLNDYSYFS